MDLFLQFGHGMMGHSRTLVQQWGGGTVILSPRDLTDGQLQTLSGQINGLPGGRVMVDPQTYLPNADHGRLIAHEFWVADYVSGNVFSGPQLAALLHGLKNLNDRTASCAVILPGILANSVTDDWLAAQRMIYDEAGGYGFGKPVVQTIALSSDACRNNEQVARLLEYLAAHPADHYYLVCEHPEGKYLVDDDAWLINILDIVAGMKLLGAKVIIGYASHQMLIAATAKADAIASGTWMNVRSFSSGKFLTASDEVRQRSTWYYSEPTLSEYKIPTLDGAQRLGLLNLLRSANMSAAVAALFGGPQPSTIGLSEADAFQHYLSTLRNQAMSCDSGSFDDAIASYQQLIGNAQPILAELAAARITGQMRDFAGCIDSSFVALEVLKATRGPMLRHNWGGL